LAEPNGTYRLMFVIMITCRVNKTDHYAARHQPSDKERIGRTFHKKLGTISSGR
jgi:hypothetical protein